MKIIENLARRCYRAEKIAEQAEAKVKPLEEENKKLKGQLWNKNMALSIFEQMGGTYRREGDYLIPNISVPDTKEYNIGKYGNLHKKFIKENYPGYYTTLLMSGKRFDYLGKIDLGAKKSLIGLFPYWPNNKVLQSN